MSRVNLEDNIIDAVIKMAEGNPGATTVLIQLTKMEDGLGFIHCLKLDEDSIYGSRIWMCYKDLCQENINELYDLVKHNKLQDAIKNKMEEDEGFRSGWNWEEQHGR